MEFNSNKPIYLQIADSICEQILNGTMKADERIPSVREYGANLGVNPNTMMRTFEILTSDGIIYNKRGIGYFISPDAKEIVMEREKKNFMENTLPGILKTIKLLGIDPSVFCTKEQ
ncbi:MAG: GntR family transcriptional regulator [Bacteroidales bacterium]|jgi:DNA-binding transcriptional regulator YhcF (GntR family)|nr:GntR family transcriptional regulator [Bacteroidales bacterium]MCI1785748.1 GntR family transcriptional regulator [Bacteroidales bacterium]